MNFTVYGVQIGIHADQAKFLNRAKQYLPPGWTRAELSARPRYVYTIRERRSGESTDHNRRRIELWLGSEELARSRSLRRILKRFESDVHLLVAQAARDKLFVHAGVVGWGRSAILIPGRSRTGKSTLVAELLRAGASYYSDEYAVLDPDGYVYPYPKALSLRTGIGNGRVRRSGDALRGRTGRGRLPVRLIVSTEYKRGARWRPRKLSPGEAVLALFANTVLARVRPEFAMPILKQAALEAEALDGPRGEASEIVSSLLQRVSG